MPEAPQAPAASEATDAAKPAIDGWFALDDSGPHLIGSRCPACGTFVFPPRSLDCPNPACESSTLEAVPLSRRGTLWSYAENRYAPPPPYPAPEPFEPFAIAAVQLGDEGLIVLGKVEKGTLAEHLEIGMEMELTIESLYRDDDGADRTVYAWRMA
ncbi:MAG: OB-fold domain-containing protein [Mycobacteriaceae bacterium]|nr:OB-fold domain-containing protein [Mycobacteriaceae bacterium]